MVQVVWIPLLLLLAACEVSDTQKTATVGAGVKQEEAKQAERRKLDAERPKDTANQETRKDAQANQGR